MKISKKEIVQWIVTLAVILVLWATGWYKPMVATLQRGILATGFFQPKPADNIDYEPFDMLFVNEEEELVSLSEMKGKVVFINIWATWCPPCRAEMPGIQKLYDEIKHEDVIFIMLSLDDKFEKAVKYKDEFAYTFPIYRPAQILPDPLQTRTIPATFVFDKNGAMKLNQEGMAQYNSKRFKSFMNELISEK